ncbi:MAG: hypothetical protein ABT940_10830 [Alphaproteobacteria bacterium]
MAVDVTIGTVYERDGASHLRWMVEAITLVEGIQHVYLRSIGDPTDVRLLASTALGDKNLFHRIGRIGPAVPS